MKPSDASILALSLSMFTRPTGDGGTGELGGFDRHSARSGLTMPEAMLTLPVFDLTAQGGTFPESEHPFIIDDCPPILGGLVVSIDGTEHFIEHVQPDIVCLLEQEYNRGALKLEDCRQTTFPNMIRDHFSDWKAVLWTLFVFGSGRYLYLIRGKRRQWY